MWKCDTFPQLVERLYAHPMVDEIIIVDNDKSNTKVLDDNKVRLIRNETNIGCNASWDQGIYSARNENVCVVNDDVIFDTYIFDKVSQVLDTYDLLGIHPGDVNFNQIPVTDGTIEIIPCTGQHQFGYGTLFFIKRTNHICDFIPLSLKTFFGDNWIYDTHQLKGLRTGLITNAFYFTKSAQTTTSIYTDSELERIKADEELIYDKKIDEFIKTLYSNVINNEYLTACDTKTDINEHLPILVSLAADCDSVCELGVRDGQSTRAFLYSGVRVLHSYDIELNENVSNLFNTAWLEDTTRDMLYLARDTRELVLERDYDLIFFDTDHTTEQLSIELERHARHAKKYLVFHDTVSYAAALIPAISNFVSSNPQWGNPVHYKNNNGLYVLKRV